MCGAKLRERSRHPPSRPGVRGSISFLQFLFLFLRWTVTFETLNHEARLLTGVLNGWPEPLMSFPTLRTPWCILDRCAYWSVEFAPENDPVET